MGQTAPMPVDVPANLTIVTLGVADLERSARFYADLGWERRGNLADGIVWFRTSGSWVGLYPYDELATDTGVDARPQDDQPEFRGITLAINLGSEESVDLAFARVHEVGGRIVKPAEPTPWGGYSGYFADPDGHLWEVAHAPMFPPDEHGRIDIAPPG